MVWLLVLTIVIAAVSAGVVAKAYSRKEGTFSDVAMGFFLGAIFFAIELGVFFYMDILVTQVF